MKRKLLIATLVIFTIALGFLRDHIFVSINHLIDVRSDLHAKLVMLKWALTALFSLLYLLSTCVLVHILFQNGRHVWMAVFSYALLFVVALSGGALGYFFSSFESVYPFVRTILGVAQSPIVMMILIPACFFDRKITREQI